jgi:menaquinone-9 beta-reductase
VRRKKSQIVAMLFGSKIYYLSGMQKAFDIIVVGGGLAGLSLAIQAARAGYSVAVIEKGTYPQHKVCGEYISMESWPFLESLGLPIESMDLPRINQLQVTNVDGQSIGAKLPLGGFGISRFLLDDALAKIAMDEGVLVQQQTKVSELAFEQEHFKVKVGDDFWMAKLVVGSFGKRSVLDVKWNRRFVLGKKKKLNNYIGIKYHVSLDYPADQIALHNFDNGYCGISKVEGNEYCLCYLTTADNLARHGNDVQQMEKAVLHKNPWLKEIFSKAKFLWPKPATIAQISFERKELVHNHVLLMGDAAGMITPLCGNGMSMALHASKLAFEAIAQFLKGGCNRAQMEKQYSQAWEKQFSRRLSVGRMIQANFGSTKRTSWLLRVVKLFPFLLRPLIRLTHGSSF